MTVNPMRGAAMNAIEPMMRSIALVEALPVPGAVGGVVGN
jgi:hypothetical protein